MHHKTLCWSMLPLDAFADFADFSRPFLRNYATYCWCRSRLVGPKLKCVVQWSMAIPCCQSNWGGLPWTTVRHAHRGKGFWVPGVHEDCLRSDLCTGKRSLGSSTREGGNFRYVDSFTEPSPNHGRHWFLTHSLPCSLFLFLLFSPLCAVCED